MPDLIERPDGTLVLPSNADPAILMNQALGWRRYSVGLDLGRNDPSALVVRKRRLAPTFF